MKRFRPNPAAIAPRTHVGDEQRHEQVDVARRTAGRDGVLHVVKGERIVAQQAHRDAVGVDRQRNAQPGAGPRGQASLRGRRSLRRGGPGFGSGWWLLEAGAVAGDGTVVFLRSDARRPPAPAGLYSELP